MSDNVQGAEGHWALTYHANSTNPRAQKWWRVVRVSKIDGRWFELYWGGSEYSSKSKVVTRTRALQAGLPLLHGHFERRGDKLEWII